MCVWVYTDEDGNRAGSGEVNGRWKCEENAVPVINIGVRTLLFIYSFVN